MGSGRPLPIAFPSQVWRTKAVSVRFTNHQSLDFKDEIMARPLRIEYAGALYHVTSRGNAQADIYQQDADRNEFLSLLSQTCVKFHWRCHAYCLMGNHYHLLIETLQPTLSKGMRFLNGVYAQRFNKCHLRVGHLLQGRFKSILVQNDTYLLELARYVVLNPVRARMVHNAVAWPWSSYRATAGLSYPLEGLSCDSVLAYFGKDRLTAVAGYQDFVSRGMNQPSPWAQLKNQIYLGSDAFVNEAIQRIEEPEFPQEIPKLHKLAARQALNTYQRKHAGRDVAMNAAYQSGHYSMAEIGRHFGVGRSTVARALKRC